MSTGSRHYWARSGRSRISAEYVSVGIAPAKAVAFLTAASACCLKKYDGIAPVSTPTTVPMPAQIVEKLLLLTARYRPSPANAMNSNAMTVDCQLCCTVVPPCEVIVSANGGLYRAPNSGSRTSQALALVAHYLSAGAVPEKSPESRVAAITRPAKTATTCSHLHPAALCQMRARQAP